MLIVDFVLVAAVAALIATRIRDKRLLKDNQKLLDENTQISEYMLSSEYDAEHFDTTLNSHSWSEPVEDTVYISPNPISYKPVVVNSTHCKNCRLVHRYIASGWDLARKKGLLNIEGFYLSGIKVPNKGCSYMPEVINITLEEDDYSSRGLGSGTILD